LPKDALRRISEVCNNYIKVDNRKEQRMGNPGNVK